MSPEVLRIRGVESAEPLSTSTGCTAGFIRMTVPGSEKPTRPRRCGKREFDAEYRIVLRDGTIKYLHTIGHPVLNEAG